MRITCVCLQLSPRHVIANATSVHHLIELIKMKKRYVIVEGRMQDVAVPMERQNHLPLVPVHVTKINLCVRVLTQKHLHGQVSSELLIQWQC